MSKTYTKLSLAALLSIGIYSSAQAQDQANSESVNRGQYLAILGDCAACHTAPNRETYSGGLPFKLPMGTIYSTNITPDQNAGIGNMTEQQFADALRKGVGRDGRALYPAMPFPSYARVSDQDVHDLYEYFMHGVTASAQETPKSNIIWPLSMRWPMKIWSMIFSPSPKTALTDTVAALSDAQIQRGAYLVQGLGHCGSCHTPRGIFMQERALTDHNKPHYLKGGQVIDGWVAPSLRSDSYLGLQNWSEEDIYQFLKTGRNTKSITFGAMDDVIVKSTSQWSDEDLKATAAYLKSLNTKPDGKTWTADDSTINNIRAGKEKSPGGTVYLDRCAACHASTGNGYPTAFPPLAGNAAVTDPDPTSLIHIILSGAVVPSVKPESPSSLTMPQLGLYLSDQEIADVATFVRQAWGNKAGSVTAHQVAKLRKTAEPVPDSDQPNN